MSTEQMRQWFQLYQAALAGVAAGAVGDALPSAMAERARKVADAAWKQWEKKQLDAETKNEN
ncbi:MAG TPA: hypothetical protein VGF90_05610, partial [Verrucomicrobiae bacterium]